MLSTICDTFSPLEVRMAKRLRHLIPTKCEIDDAEGGPLPPDVSFDDDVIGDKIIAEYEDDEEVARNEMVLTQAYPVEVAPVAHSNGVLAPLPQNISGIAASRKRAALKRTSWRSTSSRFFKRMKKERQSVNTMSMNMKKEPLK
jgi:hypothetical protein